MCGAHSMTDSFVVGIDLPPLTIVVVVEDIKKQKPSQEKNDAKYPGHGDISALWPACCQIALVLVTWYVC